MKRTIPILASLFVFSALVISVLPPLSSSGESRAGLDLASSPEKSGAAKNSAIAEKSGLPTRASVAVAFARPKPVREIAASQSTPATLRIPSPGDQQQLPREGN